MAGYQIDLDARRRRLDSPAGPAAFDDRDPFGMKKFAPPVANAPALKITPEAPLGPLAPLKPLPAIAPVAARAAAPPMPATSYAPPPIPKPPIPGTAIAPPPLPKPAPAPALGVSGPAGPRPGIADGAPAPMTGRPLAGPDAGAAPGRANALFQANPTSPARPADPWSAYAEQVQLAHARARDAYVYGSMHTPSAPAPSRMDTPGIFRTHDPDGRDLAAERANFERGPRMVAGTDDQRIAYEKAKYELAQLGDLRAKIPNPDSSLVAAMAKGMGNVSDRMYSTTPGEFGYGYGAQTGGFGGGNDRALNVLLDSSGIGVRDLPQRAALDAQQQAAEDARRGNADVRMMFGTQLMHSNPRLNSLSPAGFRASIEGANERAKVAAQERIGTARNSAEIEAAKIQAGAHARPDPVRMLEEMMRNPLARRGFFAMQGQPDPGDGVPAAPPASLAATAPAGPSEPGLWDYLKGVLNPPAARPAAMPGAPAPTFNPPPPEPVDPVAAEQRRRAAEARLRRMGGGVEDINAFPFGR